MAETTKIDWTDASVEKARANLQVPATVLAALTEELKGTMRDRSLRPAELAQLARSILALRDDPSTEIPK